MTLIEMTGSDTRLDGKNFTSPINPLPTKCPTCDFPDLDFVPSPYNLIRARANTPAQIALAYVGNFLVRERARLVIETVLPELCRFYPTYYSKSEEQTPWSLAVPVQQIVIGEVAAYIERCPTCGEPKAAHRTQYAKSDVARTYRSTDGDIYKAQNWISCESGHGKWIDRDLYFSVRLYHLLKALRIKGFYEATCVGETKPSDHDKVWIAEKLTELAAVGITVEAKAGANPSMDQWFSKYMRKNKTKTPVNHNFEAIESEHGITLPPSYKTFLSTVGPKVYSDVDEDEGADARVFAPDGMDFKFYRLGVLEIEEDDEEGAVVDGVMFADTGYGDCFCFDVARPGPEYPVLRYLHEGNYYEPYAEDFMSCIRRFAGE